MDTYGLTLLGLAIGTLGTLVGAGGGFILVPILILIHPARSSDEITAISLAVVFLNATSGSVAYAFKKRIDYRSGWIFAMASVPGALIGAYSTQYIPRNYFDPIFAIVLILMGIFIFFRPSPKGRSTTHEQNPEPPKYNLKIGIGLSALVGYFSSLLGIGGGIIHVPAMVHLLNFPVHMATATSHFVLAIMALIGTFVHWRNGSLLPGLAEILWIAPGVLIGAQLGAKLSSHLHGNYIIRALALALISVGIRLLF